MGFEIYVKELSRVFASSPPELGAIVARLSVLFEDLRIEEAASRIPKLGDLDAIGESYRKIYFVRRGIATLVEFSSALEMLDQRPEFADVRKRFDEAGLDRWRAAVKFFAANKSYLSRIRADFGGHFDHGSARHAVAEMHPDTRGVLEIVKRYSECTAGVRLKYAMELVATAMTRRRSAGQKSEAHFDEMFSIVRSGFEHAVEAMYTLAAFWILPKFGRPTR